MTQLYSIRTTSTPGEWLVKKFDADHNFLTEYVVTTDTCSGPDGHRPKCKHREMLKSALKARQVDTGAFIDWDTRLWLPALVNPGPLADDPALDNTIPSEPPTLGLSADEIAASRLAPAHETETSTLAAAASSSPRAVGAPPDEVQRAGGAQPSPKFKLLKVKI